MAGPRRYMDLSGGLAGVLRGTLLDGLRVHPHDLPGVAVEVVEATAVHEAVVLWVASRRRAGVGRGVGERVDAIARLGGDAEQRLGRPAGVGERRRREA